VAYELRARGATCRTARRVARSVDSQTDEGVPGLFAGYRCSFTAVGQVTCRRNGRIVRWDEGSRY